MADKRSSLIRCAGLVALLGNAVLAFIKIFFAFKANSLAVLGDGIDSATDVLIAFITLIISFIISQPSDKEHPWGHGRAETTASMVLSFIIFYAGAQLCISSIKNLILSFNEAVLELPSFLAINVTIISILGKTILCFSQYILGKKANSTIIKANALNMKNDIIMSASILVGLFFTVGLKMPIIDSIIAFAVSIWVIKNALELFFDTNRELMDGSNNPELYNLIFEAIKSVDGAKSPHRVRIRKIASKWDIDLDIEVDANMTVHDAHEISILVEKRIQEKIADIYDIMVHIEPEGHKGHHPTEQYGLSESDLEKTKNAPKHR